MARIELTADKAVLITSMSFAIGAALALADEVGGMYMP